MDSNSNHPIFPEFKHLDITDKNRIEELTKQFPPYSDFNFTSMWSYDTDNDVEFSWLNGNFVMRFRDYITKDPFYSFLGNTKPQETITILLNYSREQKLPEKLQLIPEVNIEDLFKSESKEFLFLEDKDQNDYIIPLKDTIALSNINPHKQESYHKFLSDYPNYEVRELEISDLKAQAEMTALFNLWVEKKKNKSNNAENELLAMKKLFDYSSSFNLTTLGIYLDNKLICYIIDERLQKPYVIGHFLKADLSYKGIYEVINKMSAEKHYKEGFEYINIEQDLGIEGLRISKQQRSPSFYLKKYTITRR